jgi:hypothetical protein
MNIRDLSFYIFQILCAASLSLFSITLVCLIVNTSICGENQTCLAITSFCPLLLLFLFLFIGTSKENF